MSLVHDAETDRRKIFAQLCLQIEEVETYKKQNNQLPIVFAERRFLETSRRINQILQQLSDFKTALFDVLVCGWTAKELYLKKFVTGHQYSRSDFQTFYAETLPFFLSKLKQFLDAAEQFDTPDFLLAEREKLCKLELAGTKKTRSFRH